MRRLCLGFVVFVVAIVAACGSSSTSPVTPPLATLPEGLQSAGEAADTEVLSLLACAGDAVVVAAYSTPNGTEIAGFRRGHEVWRKDSTLATSAGALWIGSGRIVVALVDFAGHEVVILDRVGGSWRETRASSPVIGGDPLWPAFLTGSDGAPELLCFVQAPGDHQGEAGLYLTPVDGSGERWALVRKGSFAWTGPRGAAPAGSFVYLMGDKHWAIGGTGRPQAQDTVSPENAWVVRDAITGIDGVDYVLWQPASGKMAGRLVLTSYQGGKLKSAPVPGVSDYPSARLVAGLGGGVGVVGLSEKGVVYVRQDPADPTRLVPKSVYGRNQMTAGSGSTVGLVGLRGVWCDGALHLLWYAVYRDHTDCEHRVVTGL